MKSLKANVYPLSQRTTIGLALSFLMSCAAPAQMTNRPNVNLSPLDCGYRWFQTGYSEYISMSCQDDRAPLKETQTRMAEDHAAQVALKRCPSECPPVEVQEPVLWDNPQADGVCREGRVYFLTRKFYQCSQGN